MPLRSIVILFGRDNSHLPTPHPTSWQRLALMALWVFLLSPLALYTWLNAGKGLLVGTFNARLSSGYVTIALTDHAETSEFLSAYARPVALAALALVLIYLPG